MSLKIIKSGIQDTIQGPGRTGYQWLGINPGGSMDSFASQIVNMLVGNEPRETVIEMHFPAAAFLFEKDALIAVGGANFSPTVNGEAIHLWQPVVVNQNSVLQFEQLRSGARCYLAVRDGLLIKPWLNSYSTNLKASAGGFQGRMLQKGDIIPYKKQNDFSALLQDKDLISLPWTADVNWEPLSDHHRIAVIQGSEWDWMDAGSQNNMFDQPFHIQQASDRMGYRLSGTPLRSNSQGELVSSAVNFGTIQLLPDGQLIILMADHQTTGGYPRIAHVIRADLPRVAQLRPGEIINLYPMDVATAEKGWIMQQQHLLHLQNACKFRLQEYMK